MRKSGFITGLVLGTCGALSANAVIYEENFDSYNDGDQPSGWSATNDDVVQDGEFSIGAYREAIWNTSVVLPEQFTMTFDWWQGNYGSSIYSTVQFGADPNDPDSEFTAIGMRGDGTEGYQVMSLNDGYQWADRWFNATIDNPLAREAWYTFEIEYDGEELLRTTVTDRDSGDEMFAYESPAFELRPNQTGYFGFYNYRGAPMYVDNISIVPEPGSLALLGLGGTLLLARRRRV